MDKRFEKREVWSISDGDFDNFIKEQFDLEDYDIVAVEEMSNDSTKEFRDIDGKLNKFEEKDLQKIIESKRVGCYYTRLLLDELCRRGTIEKGTYAVKISW